MLLGRPNVHDLPVLFSMLLLLLLEVAGARFLLLLRLLRLELIDVANESVHSAGIFALKLLFFFRDGAQVAI